MWLLHVTGPVGEAPLTFWLPCGTFVVGRKEGKCDILVVNMTVSRQHGLFVVQPAAQSTAMASLSFAGTFTALNPSCDREAATFARCASVTRCARRCVAPVLAGPT